MKKSIIVNICGIIFHIDEDAYEVLHNYLETLKKYFIPRKGGHEVIEDIESRITELLQPKLSDNKQSVTIEDIEEVIAILGKPEDITNSDEEPHAEKKTESQQPENGKQARRLYRDPENKKIAGVAAGMSAYFNIDPIIFRLIFVALIFASGLGVLLYLIFWFALPTAETTSQRLEMQGKNVTVSNIERNLREENLPRRESSWDKLADFIKEFFNAIGSVILSFFKAFKYVFAVLLIVVALGIIIGTNASLFFSSFAISNGFISNIGSVQEFLGFFLLPANRDILLLLCLAIILIPCAALIYWGLKILIRFKANDKWVSISMSVIWLLSIILFAILMFTEIGRYKSESINRETVALVKPTRKVLYIQSQNTTDKISEFSDENFNHSLFGVEAIKNSQSIFSPIKIEFEQISGEVPELEIVRRAHASDYDEAKKAQKAITVNYTQQDTILLIDPFFHLNGANRWNFQRVRIIVRVPENTEIHFDKTTEMFINHWLYGNDSGREPWQNTWLATSHGLEIKN